MLSIFLLFFLAKKWLLKTLYFTARAINFERERGPFKLFPVLLTSGSRSFSTCIQDVHGEKKGRPGYLEGIKISAIDTSNILDKKTYEPE